MTADDAREVLPAWGDLKDELTSSGVKISDREAQDLLDYLIKYIADDLDDEDEDELDEDEDEDEPLEGDEEGVDHA